MEKEQYVPLTSLMIEPCLDALKVGESRIMQVTHEPERASRRGVVWQSSDPSVMKVDKFGCVTGVAAGRATLSVFSWEDAQPLADSMSGPFSRTGIQDQLEIRVEVP